MPAPPPTPVDQATKDARTDAKRKAAAAQGASSTDLTKGALAPATTAGKTVTGQ
jgi:hypothetical protein